MKNQLVDYVFIDKFAVPAEICTAAIKSLESCDFSRHVFVDYNLQRSPSDTDPEVYSPHIDPQCVFDVGVYNLLMEKIETSIQKYFNNLRFEWYNGWNGYTPIKFNKYTKTTGMNLHCDHIHDIFDGTIKGIPTLTVIGVLNDQYDGGELVLFEQNEYKLKAGDIIIFPSVFLYPHAVNCLRDGVRYSFVSWVF